MDKAIRFVNSVVIGKRMPIGNIFLERIFLLMRITANREYSNGAYTEKIIGHTYEVVDTIDFRHLKVKIEGDGKPLMTNEELQALRQSGEQVAVEFINATVMSYVNEHRQSIEDSFKADGIRLVSDN